MAERIAYINGEFVPESKAVVSILDRGFCHGDAVYDVEPTFHGEIFKLEQHMDRLYRSLRYTRMDPGLSKAEMTRVTREVVEANRGLLGENDDYLVTQVVSRGVPAPTLRMFGLRATVVVHCRLIPFREFARFYVLGARVVTPSVRRMPPQCVSPKAKVTSRMNNHLADLEAKQVDPEAYSLMLDINGNVGENASGNFMFVSQGRIMVPNRKNVLQGVSMATVLELAEKLEVPIAEGDYTPFDVCNADEAFLTTSSYCVLPVVKINGQEIGSGTPGPVTIGLLGAWGKLVGVDIVARALSHLTADEKEAVLAGRG